MLRHCTLELALYPLLYLLESSQARNGESAPLQRPKKRALGQLLPPINPARYNFDKSRTSAANLSTFPRGEPAKDLGIQEALSKPEVEKTRTCLLVLNPIRGCIFLGATISKTRGLIIRAPQLWKATQSSVMSRHLFTWNFDSRAQARRRRIKANATVIGVEGGFNARCKESQDVAPGVSQESSMTIQNMKSIHTTGFSHDTDIYTHEDPPRYASSLPVQIPVSTTRSCNQSPPPFLPFTAPLHLQDNETYLKWVERERAQAVDKRRSIIEMSKVSPGRRRIYPPPCASQAGTPSTCQQSFRKGKCVDLVSASMQKPPCQFEHCSNKSQNITQPLQPSSSRHPVDKRWKFSPHGREMAFDEQDGPEHISSTESFAKNGYARPRSGMLTLALGSYPHMSVRSISTGSSDPEESLSELLSRLRSLDDDQIPSVPSVDLHAEEANDIGRGAYPTSNTEDGASSSNSRKSESPGCIFSLDGQAHINSVFNKLQEEALRHPSVRDACTAQPKDLSTTLRIQTDPSGHDYGTFKYVPFDIKVVKPVVGEASTVEATGTVVVRPPTMHGGVLGTTAKRKRRIMNPVKSVIGWVYGRLFKVDGSGEVQERRWDIPTQKWVPRGCLLERNSEESNRLALRDE